MAQHSVHPVRHSWTISVDSVVYCHRQLCFRTFSFLATKPFRSLFTSRNLTGNWRYTFCTIEVTRETVTVAHVLLLQQPKCIVKTNIPMEFIIYRFHRVCGLPHSSTMFFRKFKWIFDDVTHSRSSWWFLQCVNVVKQNNKVKTKYFDEPWTRVRWIAGNIYQKTASMLNMSKSIRAPVLEWKYVCKIYTDRRFSIIINFLAATENFKFNAVMPHALGWMVCWQGVDHQLILYSWDIYTIHIITHNYS